MPTPPQTTTTNQNQQTKKINIKKGRCKRISQHMGEKILILYKIKSRCKRDEFIFQYIFFEN